MNTSCALFDARESSIFLPPAAFLLKLEMDQKVCCQHWDSNPGDLRHEETQNVQILGKLESHPVTNLGMLTNGAMSGIIEIYVPAIKRTARRSQIFRRVTFRSMQVHSFLSDNHKLQRRSRNMIKSTSCPSWRRHHQAENDTLLLPML